MKNSSWWTDQAEEKPKLSTMKNQSGGEKLSACKSCDPAFRTFWPLPRTDRDQEEMSGKPILLRTP